LQTGSAMLADINQAKDQSKDLLTTVRLCYEYAYLSGRLQMGLGLTINEAARLGSLRQLLETPDGPRRHKRLPVAVPVTLRSSAGLHEGLLLNVSGGGMLVIADLPLGEGDKVQVRLGSQTEYTFPCQVQWTAPGAAARRLGLQLAGVPLEVRRGTPARRTVS
jgi:hypothetical protein